MVIGQLCEKHHIFSADPNVADASFSLDVVSLCIGIAIGVAIIITAWLLMRRCRKAKLTSGKKSNKTEKRSVRDSNQSKDAKRNSYNQKPPSSNHSQQRLHSKRSDSSIEEDDPFIDDKSDGNSSSFEKVRVSNSA